MQEGVERERKRERRGRKASGGEEREGTDLFFILKLELTI